MKRRSVGVSGINVSAIGLGCWGMSGSYGPADEAESVATLHHALDLGVNFIDTADSYGPYVSEELIREALHPYDGVVIATKAGLVAEGHHINFHAGHEFLVSGVVFLLIGTGVCAWAARRYGEDRRAIESGAYVPSEGSVVALTSLVVIGGLVIAAMVVWRTLVAGEA